MKINQAVCGIILNQKGVLSVTRKNTDIVSLPGGKVDEGETLTQALVREIKEETGNEYDEKMFTPVYGRLIIGDDGNNYYTTCFFYDTLLTSTNIGTPWTVEQGIECKFIRVHDLLNDGAFAEFNHEAFTVVAEIMDSM